MMGSLALARAEQQDIEIMPDNAIFTVEYQVNDVSYSCWM